MPSVKTTNPKPTNTGAKTMADKAKTEQEAEKARLAAAAEASNGDDDTGDDDSDDGAQLADGAELVAGAWYQANLTKAIRYQFAGASKAVKVVIGSYPAYLPLLPDWCSVETDETGEITAVNPLAFGQDDKGVIAYSDRTAQAIFLTATNAVKQAASLACKVADKTTGKPPKAKQYADAKALLAAIVMQPPTDLADSWEAWLATADKGGYARNCQDYTALLADVRAGLVAAGISQTGAENTARWFDLPGSMFSASDKARLVSAFVAYPTKNPLTAAQRKQQQETVLARMDEQCSLQADAHPAGSVMLAGFLTEIRAKLAAPTATAIVDDTALD